MKTINKKAQQVLKTIIQLVENSENYHVKIDKGSFMPLCAEIIGHDIFLTGSPHNFNEISLAHYGEQNGDLMSDPEMTILYTTIENELFAFPTSITQHYLGKCNVALFNDGGKWKINKKEQADQTSFLNQWLINIKNQQEL